MNIRAGKKLCGRKPMQTPASAAVSIAAVVARSWSLTKTSATANEKNASAPMPTTPAARPSRPSTMLTALTVVMMSTMVMNAACDPPKVKTETDSLPGSGSR